MFRTPLRKFVSVSLIFFLYAQSVFAGITITGADGITATGADGVQFINTSGITATGADGLLTYGVNGITATGVDGITATGADGITATGADGFTYLASNGITATGVDGITATGADGITATGVDGITITGADGVNYPASVVTIRLPNGITATGVDGITATGADGITATGADSLKILQANGITATGADGITITGADGITATGADGSTFNIAPQGITITGADTLIAANVSGITITHAGGGIRFANIVPQIPVGGETGLQSFDPELAVLINRLTDDSNVNAVVTYHHLPTDSDFADLQRLGIVGGTRYTALPMIALTATRAQLIAVSHLPAVRSIYGNRTLQPMLTSATRAETGVDRVRADADLTRKNLGLPVSGRGVAVAVLDTGVDGTHADLQGRVAQNVKLADTQSISAGFTSPAAIENLPNTDQVYGHGTFVAGVIAGNGARSGGKYAGVAPGAQIVGLSAGDLTLSFVLAGFDYILQKGAAMNVRVVNCSFSANTLFDANDPVNIATKMLTDAGVNVVFSAGNNGPGLYTLNPYAVAPWVVSVGATDDAGHLADFSARGAFGSNLFHPTLVAPGVSVVSLRSSTVASITGALGIESGADAQNLSPSELPFYTTSSGTSFSAPQVAATIALMLEANPNLTPAQVRSILQNTATPLPPYYQYEVGAGMLNAHAAVLQAAFSSRRFGLFRALLGQGQVSFTNDVPQMFSGTAQPNVSSDSNLNVPADALLASVQVTWGPMSSANNLALTLYDANGASRATANAPASTGLTGKRQRAIVKMPIAGNWRARVTNSIGVAQSFIGALEVTRVQYAPLNDIAGLSSSAQNDIRQVLRTFAMSPCGRNFYPNFSVSRLGLANALLVGGRIPQYAPSASHYADVRDATSMLAVESAQNFAGGALFTDATPGGNFHPADAVTRLTAAVALVRAAGLRATAEAQMNAPLAITDAASISSNLRGYVAVALARGWLTADGGAFRPNDALKRAELAHALAALSNSF
jgi:serine protease AprX